MRSPAPRLLRSAAPGLQVLLNDPGHGPRHVPARPEDRVSMLDRLSKISGEAVPDRKRGVHIRIVGSEFQGFPVFCQRVLHPAEAQ